MLATRMAPPQIPRLPRRGTAVELSRLDRMLRAVVREAGWRRVTRRQAGPVDCWRPVERRPRRWVAQQEASRRTLACRRMGLCLRMAGLTSPTLLMSARRWTGVPVVVTEEWPARAVPAAVALRGRPAVREAPRPPQAAPRLSEVLPSPTQGWPAPVAASLAPRGDPAVEAAQAVAVGLQTQGQLADRVVAPRPPQTGQQPPARLRPIASEAFLAPPATVRSDCIVATISALMTRQASRPSACRRAVGAGRPSF